MTEVDPAPLHSFTAQLHPTTTFDLACQISSHLLQTPCREYPAFTVGLQDMDPDEAHSFLSSLLNHNLRVLTTDGRIFWGSFKCTDPDRNIVLAQTYEYRSPSKGSEVEAVNSTKPQSGITDDMTARYLGLVVVPGHHIVKLEVDRFASQMKPQLSQIV